MAEVERSKVYRWIEQKMGTETARGRHNDRQWSEAQDAIEDDFDADAEEQALDEADIDADIEDLESALLDEDALEGPEEDYYPEEEE
jgi:hypothetical protein